MPTYQSRFRLYLYITYSRSVVVEFIVGLIAIVHPHLGFIGTTLLGVVGSVIGGLIPRLFSRPPEGSRFHPAGFLMSIVGAIILVFLARLIGLGMLRRTVQQRSGASA